MSNHTVQMQWVWKQYEDAGMPTPPTGREVAHWALEKGLLVPKERDIEGELAEDLSRAQSEIYRERKNGQRYRAKQAVRSTIAGVQYARWGDMDTEAPIFIQKALAQRRRQIVGDCYQLKIDTDHFNDIHPEVPFQMVLDFTHDVEEMFQLELDYKDGAAA